MPNESYLSRQSQLEVDDDNQQQQINIKVENAEHDKGVNEIINKFAFNGGRRVHAKQGGARKPRGSVKGMRS